MRGYQIMTTIIPNNNNNNNNVTTTLRKEGKRMTPLKRKTV